MKKKKEETIQLKRAVLVIENKKKFLVFQQKENLLMSGLYQFPFFDFEEEYLSLSKLKQWIEKKFRFKAELIFPMLKVKQSFTKYKVELFPFHIQTSEKKQLEKFEWLSKQELKQRPFCSGHRKILQEIL